MNRLILLPAINEPVQIAVRQDLDKQFDVFHDFRLLVVELSQVWLDFG